MDLQQFQQHAARTAPTHLSDTDRRIDCAMGLVEKYGDLVGLLRRMRFLGYGQEVERHHEYVARREFADSAYTAERVAASLAEAIDDDNEARLDLLTAFRDVLWYFAELATLSNRTIQHSRVQVTPSPVRLGMVVMSQAVLIQRHAVPVGRGERAAIGGLVALLESHGFSLGEVLEANVAKMRER